MRIYLSGSMASCMGTYKDVFAAEEKKLREQGHLVVNPATLPVGLDRERYMPICLSMIDGADAIYMFNGWEHSKGALLEKAYAEYQGKEVIYGWSSENKNRPNAV